jgi:hypothetical protein
MKPVVILTLSHKEVFSPYEVISLKQCHKILRNHDTYFVCPKGLDTSGYAAQLGFEPKFHFIKAKWLSSYELSNRFKTLPYLYREFSNYDYILFHEPDAFIFKDELLEWCHKGYDYIGAPWLEGLAKATPIAPYIGVGNSGLSLRKVSSHINLQHRFYRVKTTSEYWKYYQRMNWKGRLYHFPEQLFGYLFKNSFHYLLNDFSDNEDEFWGIYVPRKYKWFKIAPVSEALKFSMEVQPRRMFADNNNELPFGCHAWWRYDLAFWKAKIESFGYKL